ncbi:MAG: ParA family protein [Gammaproteobacteria bacterium]|nr:ParA family protein [Gammaproteobacteria bacterium]
MSRSTLVGVAEIAELFGVSRQAASNWRERYADFPQPAASLKSGPVWELPDILLWGDERGMQAKAAKMEALGSGAGIETACVVVALVNMKGGVGKSTLTANIGWYCAYYANLRVLMVDLDPQFNLSQYVLGNDRYEKHLEQDKPTVVDIFEQHTPGSTTEESVGREAITVAQEWNDGSLIHVIPSKLELAWTLKNPHQKEHLIRDYIQDVKGDYDLILIDCPPTESMLTAAAYMSSDYLVVPVRPEYLSTIGLPLLVRSLADYKKAYKNEPYPRLAGIVFNDSDSSKAEHNRSRQSVRKVAKRQGWDIFKGQLSHSDSYPTGARAGKPIFLTSYARSWKKDELRVVGHEFMERVGLSRGN